MVMRSSRCGGQSRITARQCAPAAGCAATPPSIRSRATHRTAIGQLRSTAASSNVCGPTLSSLGGEFGLAPLLGKSLAIISDARSGGGKNSPAVVERLLSISGEDTLTVNRKYREQWNGKLPARLHIISNELPRLGDASSAIVGRLV